MFEGSLVESRGLVVSGTQRWTALGSLTLQCAVAALLIAFPMVRPGSLPMTSNVPRLTMPMPVKPAVVPVRVDTQASSSTAMSAPTAPQTEATQRFVFPHPGTATEGPAPAFDPNLRMGTGDTGALAVLRTVGVGTEPAVSVVRAKPAGLTRVSRGVSEGLLLTPIRPVYPQIAVAARVQGTVVLEAVISGAGRIESLHVVSGPPMLQNSAVTAVQAARYRPYLLNGMPTDVQTTITVVFRLGS
jgi:protein TonB